MVESSASLLGELQDHYERLEMQRERSIAESDTLKVLAAYDTSTFDGLRYLHEVGEERNEKFIRYPHEKVVKELAEMDKAIANLQTVDRWSEEATALRQLNDQVVHSVNDLKGKRSLIW
jgi:hypothetical protein